MADKEHWEKAWQRGPIADELGYEMMKQCLAEGFEVVAPILRLTVTDDLLKSGLYSELLE
ncbi:hypothetical protein Nhal_0814 [Nitrosococcus halophilus Nc 4]|uniref:Uncharacterized protein n=1 Tax=Nitrosococcus halophilus (strain Nc4) TaxID=472759 RepID=D5BXN4_NITHN|nr:hypothetical protein Nhal_0814 [Nitrosococcus halophilus Nc 4]